MNHFVGIEWRSKRGVNSVFVILLLLCGACPRTRRGVTDWCGVPTLELLAGLLTYACFVTYVSGGFPESQCKYLLKNKLSRLSTRVRGHATIQFRGKYRPPSRHHPFPFSFLRGHPSSLMRRSVSREKQVFRVVKVVRPILQKR